MKVILIQPPVRDFYDTSIRLQPIGLAYLKSVLLKHCPEVNVILKDFHQGWGRKTIPLPKELSSLRDFYGLNDRSPFRTFHHYYHFGASFEEIAEYISAQKPDLVGISALFTPYQREVIETAEAIKSKSKTLILAGGSHVSADPEGMLLEPAIDFIIRGEGERPIVELVKVLQNRKRLDRVPNLGFKRGGQLMFNEMEENFQVEEIPFPVLDDLNPEHYTNEGEALCFIITSRGCPYKCSFCSIHQTFGKKYRRRSASSIVAEIEQRYNEGFRIIDFEDDNLAYDRAGFKELCLQLMEKFKTKEIKFTAQNGICYQNLDAEILKLMRQAGFEELNLSLVTMNAEVNRLVHRPHSLLQFNKVLSEAFKLGFRTIVYQILGLPDESIDSMIDTLIHVSELPVLPGVSPFYNIPGTTLSASIKSFSKDDQIRARLTYMGNTPDIDLRHKIFTLFIIARILYFIKTFKIESDLTLENFFMNKANLNPQEKIGIEILERLLSENRFFAKTSKGFEPVKNFQYDVFEQFWSRLKYICTVNEDRKIMIK